MDKIVEYGVLGICVGALSWVVYHFVLRRMAAECESLQAESNELRRRYDAVMMQQVSDYKHIQKSYNEILNKSRRALDSSIDIMQTTLKKLESHK